jgi:hypothetical protein
MLGVGVGGMVGSMFENSVDYKHEQAEFDIELKLKYPV